MTANRSVNPAGSLNTLAKAAFGLVLGNLQRSQIVEFYSSGTSPTPDPVKRTQFK